MAKLYDLEKVDRTTDNSAQTTHGLDKASLRSSFDDESWAKIKDEVATLGKGKELYAGKDGLFEYYITRAN